MSEIPSVFKSSASNFILLINISIPLVIGCGNAAPVKWTESQPESTEDTQTSAGDSGDPHRDTDSTTSLVPDSETTGEDASVTDSAAFEDAGLDVDSGLDTDTGVDTDTGLAEPHFSEIKPIEAPSNVIVFIGDGMGQAQIDASSIFAYGDAGNIFFEGFDVSGMMSTHSANAEITDSAAGGTALATGYKVANGIIGLGVPGDGEPLLNLSEYFKSKGKSVGLVTTATMTHATPASFGAHASSRWDEVSIADCYLNHSRPEVLFGGGGSGMSAEAAVEAGYVVVDSLDVIEDVLFPEGTLVSGQFGNGYLPYEYDGLGALPHLCDMGRTAVRLLSSDQDGFFMMLEGGRIDHAAHSNDLARLIPEVLAFERTIEELVDAIGTDDTLFVVTADHETGGLVVEQNNGQKTLPDVSWSTSTHTGAHVPIYAMGKGAEAVQAVIDLKGGLIDNTDVFWMLTELLID